MLGHDFFLHNTFRNYVIAFGNLFKEIYIERIEEDGSIVNKILVPLSYSNKEKFLIRRYQNPDLERDNVSVVLPRLSFQIDSVNYNSDRKLVSSQYNSGLISGNNSAKFQQYNPVPYDINFSLYILTDTIEDGTQIVEQILPFFKPEYTVTVNTIPALGISQDIPLTLTGTTIEDNYEPEWDKRQIIWTLNFVMLAYFFGPIKETKITKEAITDIKQSSSSSTNPNYELTCNDIKTSPRIGRITATPEPSSAGPADEYSINIVKEVFSDGYRRNPITGEDEPIE